MAQPDQPDDPDQTPEAHETGANWRAELRARGYRLTPQRELILDAVVKLGHATPDEVYAEVRTRSEAVNLSTVYRTLELFDELGVIHHAHLNDRAPTYHSTTGGQHFHLVCRNCGKVSSVPRSTIGKALQRLEQEYSFSVDIGHLTVFGSCADCGSAHA